MGTHIPNFDSRLLRFDATATAVTFGPFGSCNAGFGLEFLELICKGDHCEMRASSRNNF